MSYKLTKEHRKNIGISKTGTKHPRWKLKPSYYDVHAWIVRVKGSPKFCEICKTIKIPKGKIRWFNWHNVSGKYKRDVLDYIRVCIKCHRKLDKHSQKIKANWIIRRKIYGPNGRRR